MVPITRRASFPKKKSCIFLLIINQYWFVPCWLLAVQDTFSGEAVRERKKRRGDNWRLHLLLLLLVLLPRAQARKSSVSLLLNLIRKRLTRAYVLETDVHIYIHISRVSIFVAGEWKYKVRVKCLHISQWPSVIKCLSHTLLAQLNADQVFHRVFKPFQPIQWR